MSEKSEFGKGLVVCLAKFSEHFTNSQIREIYDRAFFLKKPQKEQDIILSGNPPPNLSYGKNKTDNFIFFMKKTVPIYGNIKSSTSSSVTLWANGASDHLYDIEVPLDKKWNKIRVVVDMLKDKGLDMGHGLGLMGKKEYTVEDLTELVELTKKALLLIDKKLGLKPDWGDINGVG